jgi:integral membrane protein (TIGR01906 family)
VHTVARGAADVLIALAVAVAILAVSMVPFLSPPYVAFAQERAEARAWTGFDEAQLRTVTDAILADLVVGPPDFDVAIDGVAVLNERERSHMRDVRSVFMGFFLLALVAVVAAGLIAARRRGAAEFARSWRAARTGALVLAVGLVAAGGVALVAFDVLFSVFHQVLFAGGSYTFDPTTERLVQLFPFRFWQESAIAVGIVAVVLGLVVAFFAGRRAAKLSERASSQPRGSDAVLADASAPRPGSA